MNTLLQALSRPQDAAAKAPPMDGVAAQSASLDSVPAFAEELLASVGLAGLSATHAAPAPDTGAPGGDAAGPSTPVSGLGLADGETEGQASDAPPLPDAVAAIAGQGQAAAGEALGAQLPGAAIPATADSPAATPAAPAAANGSGGVVETAIPAVPAGVAPAQPPVGQGGPPATGTGAELEATAAQQGLQESTLGQAVPQIASATEGSAELPNLLHAAMESAGQPRFLSPGAASTRPDRPEGGLTTASAMTARNGMDAIPATANATAADRLATPGVSSMASETAALQANSAANRADLLPSQGDVVGTPNTVLAPSPSALAAGDAGPEMTLRSAVPQQPAVDQVAIAIQKAQNGGREQISLRLYPAELGRIEVHLELADDGVLRASILAEKADTLELLQRDSGALERALQNAGVKTDSGSLAFDLKNGGRDGEAGPEGADRQVGEAPPDELDEASTTSASGRPPVHLGLLDMSV